MVQFATCSRHCRGAATFFPDRYVPLHHVFETKHVGATVPMDPDGFMVAPLP
jgi:hypothetical protein